MSCRIARLLDEDDWEVKVCALECLTVLGRLRKRRDERRQVEELGSTWTRLQGRIIYIGGKQDCKTSNAFKLI